MSTSTSEPTPEQVTPQPDDVARLREELIRELRELAAIVTREVERAVRAVPRHLFVPELRVAEAYAAERHYVTKEDELGISVSSVSAARVRAMMLEQAQIRPGMRVLDVLRRQCGPSRLSRPAARGRACGLHARREPFEQCHHRYGRAQASLQRGGCPRAPGRDQQPLRRSVPCDQGLVFGNE
ncbi:hypothetical protein [Parafrankia sp. EUN1f]|uniref:hypothetical protein n=1 Tax=Parafrankia sp. EUN1f TaxID=102897 RepID=UPI0001C45345|nr:hypothetical protein [Parafrankia sp. EUN1f]EFC78920.1 hypothetical protein FrEUN1fDRAFT_7958 [Parafrankia sp. EUN1f]